jgi:hypothetical protein
MTSCSGDAGAAPEDEGYDAAVMVSGDIAFLVLSTGAYDLLVPDDYLSDRHCDFRRFTNQR